MANELIKSEKSVVVSDAELTMHLENLGLLKDLTTGEKNSYLQIAKAFNLNPFKREIHVSKYNGQMSIITGYEVYLKRAERTGLLDGWKATTTGSVKDGDLKAFVTIYRKDRAHPFEWEVLYNECVQRTREGVPTKFWQKAEFMTKKVCISQAFRLCFSDELGGMPYTKEEMADAEAITEDVPHEEVPNTNQNVVPVTATISTVDKAYRTVTNDVELITELIDNAKDAKLLKLFCTVNSKFFNSNPEMKERLIKKGQELNPQPKNDLQAA